MANLGYTLPSMDTDSDPLAAFRTELTVRRTAAGLNYSEAARRAGITPERWSTIERGFEVKGTVRIPANPRRRTLLRMAEAVEWSAAEALAVAGHTALTTTETGSTASVDARVELVRLLPALSDSRARALLYVAQAMQDPQTHVPAGEGAAVPTQAGTESVEIVDADPGAADREHRAERRDTDSGGDGNGGF